MTKKRSTLKQGTSLNKKLGTFFAFWIGIQKRLNFTSNWAETLSNQKINHGAFGPDIY